MTEKCVKHVSIHYSVRETVTFLLKLDLNSVCPIISVHIFGVFGYLKKNWLKMIINQGESFIFMQL